MTTEAQEITKGVIFYKTRSSNKGITTFSFEIENQLDLKTVEVTIDCSGSKNFAAADGSVVGNAGIDPHERRAILIISQQDARQGWSMSFSISTTIKSASDEILERHLIQKEQHIEMLLRTPLERRPHHVDDAFPPHLNSLNFGGIPPGKLIEWRKPSEFMEGRPSCVFDDDIKPGDIFQGELGDCWFLSSLSELSETPDLILRLFVTQQCTEEGRYRILVCKHGWWAPVDIDDYLPCRVGGTPIYAQAKGGELWPALIEKMYAKVHGCYEAIVAGNSLHALSDLTGAPGLKLDLKDENGQPIDDVFYKLLKYDGDSFMITASTESEESETAALYQKIGLLGGHCYSILAVREVGSHKLIQIRNPWGAFEWNGDWGDNSPSWTPDLKEAVGFTAADDGAFWMCFDDFARHFCSVGVCFFKSSWYQARARGRFTSPPSGAALEAFGMCSPFYQIHVPDGPTRTFLTLHQRDHRGDHDSRSKPFQLVGFHLLRPVQNEGREIRYELMATAKHDSAREVFIEIDLEPTEIGLPYLVVPSCYASLDYRTRIGALDFVVSAQSERPIKIGVCAEDRLVRSKVLYDYCMTGEKSELSDNINLYWKSDGFVAFIAAENMTNNLEISLNLSFSDSHNVLPFESDVPMEYPPQTLGPYSRMAVAPLVGQNLTEGCSFSYSLSAEARFMPPAKSPKPEYPIKVPSDILTKVVPGVKIQYLDDIEWGQTTRWAAPRSKN